MTKWYKKEYVCSMCDALIEITTKSEGLRDKYCYECNGNITLLSVADATIYPTKTKEEQMEITTDYNPSLLVTYKKINDGSTEYVTEKVSDIEWALNQSRRNYQNLTEKQNQWYTKESKLRSLLEEVYADSEDQETLANIAEIFDVPLTKEIEYTAWVRVDMTVEVELGGDVDAVEDFISSNLTIDSYDSLIQVTNYEVERTEEGAY